MGRIRSALLAGAVCLVVAGLSAPAQADVCDDVLAKYGEANNERNKNEKEIKSLENLIELFKEGNRTPLSEGGRQYSENEIKKAQREIEAFRVKIRDSEARVETFRLALVEFNCAGVGSRTRYGGGLPDPLPPIVIPGIPDDVLTELDQRKRNARTAAEKKAVEDEETRWREAARTALAAPRDRMLPPPPPTTLAPPPPGMLSPSPSAPDTPAVASTSPDTPAVPQAPVSAPAIPAADKSRCAALDAELDRLSTEAREWRRLYNDLAESDSEPPVSRAARSDEVNSLFKGRVDRVNAERSRLGCPPRPFREATLTREPERRPRGVLTPDEIQKLPPDLQQQVEDKRASGGDDNFERVLQEIVRRQMGGGVQRQAGVDPSSGGQLTPPIGPVIQNAPQAAPPRVLPPPPATALAPAAAPAAPSGRVSCPAGQVYLVCPAHRRWDGMKRSVVIGTNSGCIPAAIAQRNIDEYRQAFPDNKSTWAEDCKITEPPQPATGLRSATAPVPLPPPALLPPPSLHQPPTLPPPQLAAPAHHAAPPKAAHKPQPKKKQAKHGPAQRRPAAGPSPAQQAQQAQDDAAAAAAAISIIGGIAGSIGGGGGGGHRAPAAPMRRGH